MKTHFLQEVIDKIQGKAPAAELRPLILEPIVDLMRKPEKVMPAWHPLGFIYLRLKNENPGLRLHIWPSSGRNQPSELTVHDHYYDLDSFVLTGTLKNNIYRISSESPFNSVIYKGEYDKEKVDRSLRKTDQLAHYKLQKTFTISANEHYHIPRDVFHTTDVDANEFTATIVAISNPKPSASPNVVGRKDGKDAYHFKAENCSPEAFHAALAQLKYLLCNTR